MDRKQLSEEEKYKVRVGFKDNISFERINIDKINSS